MVIISVLFYRYTRLMVKDNYVLEALCPHTTHCHMTYVAN